MPNFLKLITLTSFVALSSTAMAQETEAPKPQTDTVTPADTTADASPAATEGAATEATTEQTPEGLSMGEDVVDENAPGTTYVLEQIGDWELRCVRVPEGQKEPCQLFQLLKDDQGTAISEINFVTLAKGGQAVAGATIVVPLETLLTKQVTLSVDDGAKKRYPFRFCNQTGCYSQVGFSNADVAAFKRGAAATLTIVPVFAPDKTIAAKLSLDGFTKAYDTLKALNSE